ncbi:MAG: polysaccharide biosynthesis/export family protein [Acidobacteriota bacterium]|nr:polysaccharide biosynthesis/export family protein [Acidobacteriota bacterium]
MISTRFLRPAATGLATILLGCLLASGTAVPAQVPGGAVTGVTPGVTSGIQSQAPAGTAASTNSAAPGPGISVLYPGEDFQLGPGDLINIRLFGGADYTAIVRVDSTGNVELPYIGSVPLSGLSIHAAQQLIASRLRTGGFYLDPEIIIQVIESLNSSVTVAGELRGSIPITGARRLIDVLSAAGGLPASASHTVRIVRPGNPPRTITVNLGADLTNSEAAEMLVYPRDIIQISRSGVIFVLGAFKAQGSLPLDQSMPLTLIQVAALSGGVGYEGRYEDLRLIRTFGSERRVVKVDIKKVLNGHAPDPVLQANDIVYLPTNQMKAAAKSLGVGGIIGLVSLVISLRGL